MGEARSAQRTPGHRSGAASGATSGATAPLRAAAAGRATHAARTARATRATWATSGATWAPRRAARAATPYRCAAAHWPRPCPPKSSPLAHSPARPLALLHGHAPPSLAPAR